jgi:hypothetical protein
MVFAGNDVVDFKGRVICCLGNIAVFTAAVCPSPDKPDKCRVHGRCLRDCAFLELDAQGAAGPGFQDGEDSCGLAEVVHFFLLGWREVIILISHGKFVHSGLIAFADCQINGVAGDGFGQRPVAVGEEAGEDVSEICQRREATASDLNDRHCNVGRFR